MTAEDLVRRAEQQAQAFIIGDMARWRELLPLDPGFTLLPPFGGPASHGFDASPERLAALSRAFRNGEAAIEVVQVVVGQDMAMVAMIERQHGEVHGLPDQDWSLRVTQVYRRQGEAWLLAHRHADPLVRPMSVAKTATLARGA